MALIDDISDQQAKPFLTELLQHYVERQGLGAMPKADMDALILHLYMVHAGIDEADPYELSRRFKIKESRVKTLLESAWVKFVDKSEQDIWREILSALAVARIERESLERGEVRFKLQNPGHMPFFRKEVRELQGTVSYSAAAERVVLSMDTFNALLERVYEVVFEKDEDALEPITSIYEHLKADVLGDGDAPNLEQRQTSKLGKALERGTQLAGIGQLILQVFSIAAVGS